MVTDRIKNVESFTSKSTNIRDREKDPKHTIHLKIISRLTKHLGFRIFKEFNAF